MAKKSQMDRCEFFTVIEKYRLPGEKDHALAKRIGVTPSTIDNWRLGRVPRMATLFTVARGLNVDAVSLLKECLEIPVDE